MEPKYEYSRTTYSYHNNYVRNSRAVGVLWSLFTICFAILNILVFSQQHWLGSTESGGSMEGRLGLYQICTRGEAMADAALESDGLHCKGSLDSFGNQPSPFLTAATILMGVSALLILLCIACMLLFFFLSAKAVFCICGWLQCLAWLCFTSGVFIFPLSWDVAEVRLICGHEAGRYAKGSCEFRWAFILAIIGAVDLFFLAVLAFVLALRQVRLLPKVSPRVPGAESTLGFNGVYSRGPVIAPADSDSQIDPRFKTYAS